MKYVSITFLLLACNIEYKVHSHGPPVPAGECDIENPIPSPENFKPIAVCSSSTVQVSPVLGSVDFIGEESYDPTDYKLIDYAWEIVESPEGSVAALGYDMPNKNAFVPDLAGEYVVELVVMNERCVVSDPCQVKIEAVPSQDLWVEMIWEYPGDDMDLHLVKDNASYQSDGDCYYGNCVAEYGSPSLDWGDPASEMDDPRLDLDDIDNVGPENINIADPAAGKYRVVVHDYPGSVNETPNTVTVKIHMNGELVYEDSKVISGEDTYTPFAEIDWPNMTIQEL